MTNDIHGFNIDMLRICFEAEDPELLDNLMTLELGEKCEFYTFYLVRTEGQYYENVFQIRYDELGQDKLFGELRFGLNRNNEEAGHRRVGREDVEHGGL